jgi:hypothetical protein
MPGRQEQFFAMKDRRVATGSVCSLASAATRDINRPGNLKPRERFGQKGWIPEKRHQGAPLVYLHDVLVGVRANTCQCAR